MNNENKSLGVAQNLSQSIEMLNFIKDERNLRMFLVFLNKKFTWDRELRSFGFSYNQIQYSREFLINKGLIEVKNLEELDIKIIEFIGLSMPNGDINPDLQVLSITKEGYEWGQLLKEYIDEEQYKPLLNKVFQKIEIIRPFLIKVSDLENSRLERELLLKNKSSQKILIETEKGKQHNHLIKNFKTYYLEALKEQNKLNHSQKQELAILKSGQVAVYEETKQNKGSFYNGQRISASEERYLLEIPEDKHNDVGLKPSNVSENVKSRQNGLLNQLGIDIDEKNDFEEIVKEIKIK